MIGKKNSALIFDPNIFLQKIHKQTRILLSHLKHMKYSAALPMFLIWRDSLLSYDNMRVFFSHTWEVKGMWFFMKKYSQNSA